MATRKTRMNTDSPTPNSGSESTPSTPTNAVQKRLTRKMFDAKTPVEEPAAVSSPSTSAPTTAETAATNKKVIKQEQISPGRKRTLTKTSSKDDLSASQGSANDEAKPFERTVTPSGATTPEEDRTKRTRRPVIEKRIVLKGTARGRKSLPVILQKDLLMKRRNSTGRVDSSDRKQSARLNKETILRSGRPRKPAAASPEKVVRVIRKRTRPVDKHEDTTEAEDLDEEEPSANHQIKILKQELSDEAVATPSSEVDSDSGRRSNSNSSSTMDMPLHLLKVKDEPKDEIEADHIEPIVMGDGVKNAIDEIPADVIDPVETAEKILDKVPEPVLRSSNEDVPEISLPVIVVAEVKIANPKSTESSTTNDTTLPNISTRPKRSLVRHKSGSPSVAAVAPIIKSEVMDGDIKVNSEPAVQTSIVLQTDIGLNVDDALNDVSKNEEVLKIDIDDNIDKLDCEALVEAVDLQIETQEEVTHTETESEALANTEDPEQIFEQLSTPSTDKVDTASVVDNEESRSALTPPKTPPLKESSSPVPVAEGVSPISVKAFYGQPDFLENNPGIEDDPKLRAIVKEHATIGDEVEPHQITNLLDAQKSEDNMSAEMDERIVEEALNEVPEVKLKDELETEDLAMTRKPMELITQIKEEKLVADEPMAEPDDKENIILKDAQSISSPSRAPLGESSNEPKDVPESPETLRQKESHFLKLGLLTHRAASAAKIEKEKRRESMMSNSSKSGKKTLTEYTGTLKTIIKLNRPATGAADSKAKKPGRQSGALKMTLHKGRRKSSATASSSAAGSSGTEAGTAAAEEDTYYTIHTEAGESADGVAVHGGQSRKTHNRSHTIDGTVGTVDASDANTVKEPEVLVIPEKASSFRIHPDKLCQDQCFYCGGKFGLFDTPCHVAGIKSVERQQKILANEEKLTVDNCLCDACFRHVDRRANCPIYKQRTTNVVSSKNHTSTTYGRRPSNEIDPEDTMKNEDGGDLQLALPDPPTPQRQSARCQVVECQTVSSHSIRRKWYMKMRRQIGKLLTLNPEAGTPSMLSICVQHYNVIGHLMVCTLCKRKLVRNHIYYINQDVTKLEQLLTDQRIPVTIGTSPVVCKLCRYFSNLLLKPPEKPQKTAFVKEYRRRLLQFHNVDVMEDSDDSQPPTDANQQKTKQPEPHEDQPPAKKLRMTKRNRKSSPTEDSISIPSSMESGGAQDEQDHGSLSPQSESVSESNQDSSHIAAKIMADYEQSQSISILPRSKATTSVPSHLLPKAQVILVETGDTEHTKEDLSALRANPNISMRELFPGEEEMGLQVNIPFGVVGAQRTPDGWTKCQTTIQYDDSTRNMWEELQKPYGNQSSFMRHLILLEKYFRNGDLVLSAGAGCSAVNYAESVQQRLQSYDSKIDANDSSINSTSISMLANSLFSNNNHSNSSISIIPTGSKPKPKSSIPEVASTSLLKSKRNSGDNKSKEKTCHVGPPELISINTSNKQVASPPTAQYSNQGQHSSTSTNSPSASTSSSPTNLTMAANLTKNSKAAHSLLIPQNPQPSLASNNPTTSSSSGKKQSASKPTEGAKQSETPVIRLPDVLTQAERMESKMWRPTLMPVSAGPPALNGQLYQTADGRKLPNLVQVQSGGNPYLISIHDYNRMCILRRERLLRDQMMQRHQQQPTSGANTSMPHALSTSGGAQNLSVTMQPVQTSTPKTNTSKSGGGGGSKSSTNPSYSGSGKVQIPNKILEQNSLIPLSSSSGPSGKGVSALDSLLKVRKPNPTSLLKPNINSGSKSNHPMGNNSSASTSSHSNVVSITSTPSIAAILGVGSPANNNLQQQQQQYLQNQMLQTQKMIQQQFLQQQMAYQQMTSAFGSGGSNKQITPNVTASLAPLSGSWSLEPPTKNNNQDNMMGGSAVDSLNKLFSWAGDMASSRLAGLASGSGASSMDASVLSKIPKSLTVIPQQKDRRSFPGKSGDDHNHT